MRRLRYGRKSAKILAEINVVPFIDVMLVLLVIFMMTTPLLTTGIQVNLPQQSYTTNPITQHDALIVTVDATGKYYANFAPQVDHPLSASALTALIKAKVFNNNVPHDILVRGDKNANYGTVMNAMLLLKASGIKTVSLLTEFDHQKRN